MNEDLEMFPELYYKMSFGRQPVTVYADGNFFAACQIEKNGKNAIALYKIKSHCKNAHNYAENSYADGQIPEQKEVREWEIIESEGNPFQCALAAGRNEIFLVWNEVSGRTWFLKYAVINPDGFSINPPHTMYTSESICLTPSVAVSDNQYHIVFSEKIKNRFVIQKLTGYHGSFTLSGQLSDVRYDSFRPSAAVVEGRLYYAYDRYRKKKYEIVFAIDSSKSSSKRSFKCSSKKIKIFSNKNERLLMPKLYAHNDTVYLLGTALQEVCDDKGIFDHRAYAFTAIYKNGSLRHLKGSGKDADSIMSADLREGLLAETAYMGYHGLRRNPMLSFSKNGTVYLFYEMMKEKERDCQNGHLMMRTLCSGGIWDNPRIIHSGGYSFSVPSIIPSDSGKNSSADANSVPIAYFDYTKNEMDLLQTACISPVTATVYNTESFRFTRWYTARPDQILKDRTPVTASGGPYRMYWADTHCHSVLSPDAEGEVDELINYARDFAGLDAVCITDNDFYPFKALTVPEWNMHEALAERYTVPGSFTVFPGYEYTFHRRDLPQKFNHRIVFYPRSGGKLRRRIDPGSMKDSEMLAQLKETNAVAYPHHVTYEITNPDTDRNVEIISSWRVYMAEADFTKKQLLSGQRVGFIGSSDSHRAAPGMGGAWTGIYARSLDPEDLAEAYRARRLIATQGFPIFVDFRAGEAFIGEETEYETDSGGGIPVYAEVRAHKNIEYVKLYRDAISIHEVNPGKKKIKFNFTYPENDRNVHFYYLEIKLTGDPSFNLNPAENSLKRFDPFNGPYPHNLARARGVFAWTSPVWVRRKYDEKIS